MNSKKHSLRRTSPKGEDFIGVCVLCGQENLTFKDMQSECENLRGLSPDEAVLEALDNNVH